MVESLIKIPTYLKSEVKRLCRRYGIETTMGAFVDYICTHKSAEYDDQFAQEMQEAFDRYLERRGKR